MIYVVNCDKLKLFETFDSLDSVVNYLDKLNESNFDGEAFSLFGRGQKQVFDGEQINFVNDFYYIDSAVLCPEGNPNEYFTFFIRCIDSKGNRIELD